MLPPVLRPAGGEASDMLDALMKGGVMPKCPHLQPGGPGCDCFGDLAKVDVLPQARLKQLAARGVILSVMTFEDFMSPTVHWIEPEEFGIAFDQLTQGEATMPDDRYEAAHTDTGVALPSFINARKGMMPGTVLITVRSAKGDAPELDGGTAHHVMDLQDLDQWIADVQRLRQAL